MNLPDPNEKRDSEPAPQKSPQHDPGADADSAAVERLLASFAPRPARIDRDRTLFLAGQASAVTASAEVVASVVANEDRPTIVTSRTPWYWPASTVVASLIASALAVLLVVRTDSTNRSAPSRVITSGSPVAQGPEPKVGALPPTVTPTQPPPQQVESRLGRLTSGGFLQLRELALDTGVESLPIPHAGSGKGEKPTTYVQALQSAIERPNAFSMGMRY